MGSAGAMRRIQDFSGFFVDTTRVLCGDALIDLDIGSQLFPQLVADKLPFLPRTGF